LHKSYIEYRDSIDTEGVKGSICGIKIVYCWGAEDVNMWHEFTQGLPRNRNFMSWDHGEFERGKQREAVPNSGQG
jgi:hypothetical protein